MSFSSQIAAFNKKAEARMRATARESVQDVISEAQRVRRAGGRMRIKFGFLRASIQAAIGQIPKGPTTNESDRNFPAGSQVSGEPVSVTLLRWDPNKGTPLFVGWTANYARFRERKDGFMRGAVEKWDRIVDKAAQRVKAKI